MRKHLDSLPERIPRPPGCLKLTGYADEYRIRIGDYRVRYPIDDEASEIAVIHVRHRKDIYRD